MDGGAVDQTDPERFSRSCRRFTWKSKRGQIETLL